MQTRDGQKIIDSTLLNLKILGCIKKTDKLVINKEVLEIENNDYLTPFRRWWFGRDRNETIEFIKNVINQAFNLTDKTLESVPNQNSSTNKSLYFNEDSTSLLQRFVYEMSNARKGLESLKATYTDDTRLVSELDILIEQIGMRIDKINRILKIDIDSIDN